MFATNLKIAGEEQQRLSAMTLKVDPTSLYEVIVKMIGKGTRRMERQGRKERIVV
jgi:hypothetical protein